MIEKNPITESRVGLPDPDDFPNSDIAIYDGKCKFCTAGVKRLHWLDGKNRLSFISLNDERMAELCPELSHDQLMEQLYLIPRSKPNDTKKYGGAEAFRYLTRRLPKLWILAPFTHIPFSLPVWQWLYMQVAKRRYKMGQIEDPCEDGTCSIHFDK